MKTSRTAAALLITIMMVLVGGCTTTDTTTSKDPRAAKQQEAAGQTEEGDAGSRIDSGESGVELSNFSMGPGHMTHMAAIRGCMKHLNRKVSDGWLYGSTGYAFIMNIMENVDVAGPTCLEGDHIRDLLSRNLGISTQRLSFPNTVLEDPGTAPDFAEKQKTCWEFLKGKLKAGIPCYGWGVTYLENIVIYGYRDDAILFSSQMVPDGRGHVSWREFGRIDHAGNLMVASVEPIDVTFDDRRTVKDALGFALIVGSGKAGRIFCGKSGLAAYDAWIDYMTSRKADIWGISYNADCWHECRYRAEQFLREAGERLGGQPQPLFEEAADHYKKVHEALNGVRGLFPQAKAFQDPPHAFQDSDYAKAIGLLRSAKRAEGKALAVIAKILAQL
jgi:hypothetical protein